MVSVNKNIVRYNKYIPVVTVVVVIVIVIVIVISLEHSTVVIGVFKFSSSTLFILFLEKKV